MEFEPATFRRQGNEPHHWATTPHYNRNFSSTIGNSTCNVLTHQRHEMSAGNNYWQTEVLLRQRWHFDNDAQNDEYQFLAYRAVEQPRTTITALIAPRNRLQGLHEMSDRFQVQLSRNRVKSMARICGLIRIPPVGTLNSSSSSIACRAAASNQSIHTRVDLFGIQLSSFSVARDSRLCGEKEGGLLYTAALPVTDVASVKWNKKTKLKTTHLQPEAKTCCFFRWF